MLNELHLRFPGTAAWPAGSRLSVDSGGLLYTETRLCIVLRV